LYRTHQIEEDERPNHLPVGVREGARRTPKPPKSRVKRTTLDGYKIIVAHIRLIGKKKISDLTTAANRAKSHLRSITTLAEEDFGVRAPAMPTGLNRGRPKPKKAILTLEQVGLLLEEARRDLDHGVYFAFPFLAGTRPSEQLGLLWSEVDFDTIHICRIQERDGSLIDMTKTEAGTRAIPMGSLLRAMLLDWRLRCPR
jgi:integrase